MQKECETKLSGNLEKSIGTDRKFEIVSLAKGIISGEISMMNVEMGVSFSKNIESPALMSVFKGEDEFQIGISTIKILVDRFADSFGFSTKLSPTQTETLCIDTFENFRGESLGDIILFFKMARNGSFGTTHKGIDSNLVFGDWFPKYMMLKAEEREKAHKKKISEEKRSELTIDDVHKHYKKFEESQLQKVVNWVDKITEGMTREQLEKEITEWQNDAEKSKFIRVLIMKRNLIK